MAKVSIVAPLGTSPPVITEFVQYVIEGLGERLTDLTVLLTREPLVLQSYALVEASMLDRYPKVRLHTKELPFEDILGEEENLRFMELASDLLAEQVLKHRVERIYLNIAGGRKNMVVSLSLLALFFPVAGLYHIVMPDVKAFSQQLERARGFIEDLNEAQDRVGYYRQHRDILEPLMFPPLGSYEVMRIPLLPYPRELLVKLLRLKRDRATAPRTLGLSEDYLSLLERNGIITSGKSGVYATDVGSRVIRAVGRLWG